MKTLLLALLLLPAFAVAQDARPVHAQVADAATALLASLDDDAREATTYEFKDEVRQKWHFVPGAPGRPGAVLGQLSDEQVAKVDALLATVLNADGLKEVQRVRGIQGIGRYHIAVFGEPSTKKDWGFRYEGHHLSISVTLKDGTMFSVTPTFFGASPMQVKKGPEKGTRVFAKEIDLAKELVGMLSDEQIALAAPKKIAKGPGATTVEERGKLADSAGIPFAKLTEEQQKKLAELVRAYTEKKFRSEVIADIAGRGKVFDPESLHFAFQGEKGEIPAYYRILGKNHVIHASTGGGNHLHAAWRHFDGDFGRKLGGH